MTATLQVPIGITGLTGVTAVAVPYGAINTSGTVVNLAEYTNDPGNYAGTTSVTGDVKLQVLIGSDLYPDPFYAFIGSSGVVVATTTHGNTTQGQGPYPVAISVQDIDDNPLQNAVMNVFQNGLVVATTLPTGTDGIAAVSLPPGTYILMIFCPGFLPFDGTSSPRTVSSPGYSAQIRLATQTITPSTPPEVTGYLTCVDQHGNALQAVLHTVIMLGANGTGASLSSIPIVARSASNGVVEFTGLIAGATYTISRQGGKTVQFVAGNTTFELPNVIG